MVRESHDLCGEGSGGAPIALARIKSWIAGDVLTAADLNAEFNNILNNPTSLINLSAAGDLCIVSSASAVTRLAIGTAGQAVTVSTGLLPVWSAPVLQSYLSGLQITAIGGTSSGTITHSSGVAVDSTSNTIAMVLSSALVGTTTGAFIAGNNQPKLQVSPLAASTSYHIYVMSSVLGGATDVLYSSSTSPTLPTGYAKSRRVGSFMTGSTGNILAMTQDGDYFRLAASILDVTVNNPGTVSVTRTLTMPVGVNVEALVNVIVIDTGAANGFYLRDLSANDEAASTTVAPLVNAYMESGSVSNAAAWEGYIRTNASAQIGSRLVNSSTGTSFRMASLGWRDPRGRSG